MNRYEVHAPPCVLFLFWDRRECLMREEAGFGEGSDGNWKRAENHSYPLLGCSPLISGYFCSHSCASLSARPPGESRHRGGGRCGKCSCLPPTRSYLAMKHFLCWLTQLLSDPKKTGERGQHPRQRRAGHTTGESQHSGDTRHVWGLAEYQILGSHSGAPPGPFPLQGREIIASKL